MQIMKTMMMIFFLGDALEATNNSAYYKVCAVCGCFDKCISV